MSNINIKLIIKSDSFQLFIQYVHRNLNNHMGDGLARMVREKWLDMYNTPEVVKAKCIMKRLRTLFHNSCIFYTFYSVFQIRDGSHVRNPKKLAS